MGKIFEDKIKEMFGDLKAKHNKVKNRCYNQYDEYEYIEEAKDFTNDTVKLGDDVVFAKSCHGGCDFCIGKIKYIVKDNFYKIKNDVEKFKFTYYFIFIETELGRETIKSSSDIIKYVKH